MSDAFGREIAVIIDEMKTPKQRSAILARFARQEIAAVTADNERATGEKMRKPRITVDGRRGAAIGTVKPDGTIVAEFNAETNVVRWILVQLEIASPELTGAYEKSHTLFVDGLEYDGAGEIPDAREYVIASDLPYAKKLDRSNALPARSKQAPNGVYEAVATVASRRFSEEAKVKFTFRDVPARDGKTYRQPSIVITPY